MALTHESIGKPGDAPFHIEVTKDVVEGVEDSSTSGHPDNSPPLPAPATMTKGEKLRIAWERNELGKLNEAQDAALPPLPPARPYEGPIEGYSTPGEWERAAERIERASAIAERETGFVTMSDGKVMKVPDSAKIAGNVTSAGPERVLNPGEHGPYETNPSLAGGSASEQQAKSSYSWS